MKKILLLVFFGNLMFLNAQYLFTGEVLEGKENQTVYLSLVENYRKSSRVYANQIIKETKTDANGYFKFKGDNLSPDNRIYRIHIDGCEEIKSGGSHFLKDCNYTQRILFIAKKTDTITFPLLQNKQALCEVTSTNKNSRLLLEVDALKEEMILDFMEYHSKANESLNFKKWFKTFKEYGINNNEPLVDLYIYGFLSDRASETYEFYLEDIKSSSYYNELEKRLVESYKTAPFTLQYMNELFADKKLVQAKPEKTATFGFYSILLIIIAIVGIPIAILILKNRLAVAKRSMTKKLTPQELNVFEAMKNGLTNKEIASELFISLSTVKTHINSIYKKLNISSREEITKNQPGV